MRVSERIGVVVVALSMLSTTGANDQSRAAGSSLVGSLDINDPETGDGAGCFFFLADDEPKIHVLIDRDDHGWVRIDGKIEKLEPARDFVMWPSNTGGKLERTYRSEGTKAELNIEVSTGCGERADNCLVIYEGRLELTHGDNNSTLRVKGNCGG